MSGYLLYEWVKVKQMKGVCVVFILLCMCLCVKVRARLVSGCLYYCVYACVSVQEQGECVWSVCSKVSKKLYVLTYCVCVTLFTT